MDIGQSSLVVYFLPFPKDYSSILRLLELQKYFLLKFVANICFCTFYIKSWISCSKSLICVFHIKPDSWFTHLFSFKACSIAFNFSLYAIKRRNCCFFLLYLQLSLEFSKHFKSLALQKRFFPFRVSLWSNSVNCLRLSIRISSFLL